MRSTREVPATDVTVRTDEEILDHIPLEVHDRVGLLAPRARHARRWPFQHKIRGFTCMWLPSPTWGSKRIF